MKFAAIDIGSNGVRMLLKRVILDHNEVLFKKEALFRMPIRLGEDAFLKREISPEKTNQLISSMKGFRHLIEAYDPIDYLAYATSAMREALNGGEIVKRIKTESGIDLKIIDGHEEAHIIFSNHIEENMDHDKCYLYIDIGGGSTELVLLAGGRMAATDSFRIGTVRIVKGLDDPNAWTEMKDWIKKETGAYSDLIAIGSGGNVNKIFRLARKKDGQPISIERLKKIRCMIEMYDVNDRIKILGLRPDRADVILPAINIYISILEWAGIKKMHIPQIGLADGMIHMLYDQFTKRSS